LFSVFSATMAKEKAVSSTFSALMFVLALGFMAMSTMVLYQRRLITETSSLANELKIMHEAQRSLSRALKEEEAMRQKQKEVSAEIQEEEDMIKQYESLMVRRKAEKGLKAKDKEKAEGLLAKELAKEKVVNQDIAAFKAMEGAARYDEQMAENLFKRLEGEVKDEDLLQEQKQDMNALEMLNKTLVEFETMDKALEARQSALHAKLETLRYGLEDRQAPQDQTAGKGEMPAAPDGSVSVSGQTGGDGLIAATLPPEEAKEAKALLNDEKKLMEKVKDKEGDAKEAMNRAEKLLQESEALILKGKTKKVNKRLDEEKKKEKELVKLLEQAKQLLEKAHKDEFKLEHDMQGVAFVEVKANKKCHNPSLLQDKKALSLHDCYESCLSTPQCAFFVHWPSGHQKDADLNDHCRMYKAPCEPWDGVKEGSATHVYMMLKAAHANLERFERQVKDLQAKRDYIHQKREKLKEMLKSHHKPSGSGSPTSL